MYSSNTHVFPSKLEKGFWRKKQLMSSPTFHKKNSSVKILKYRMLDEQSRLINFITCSKLRYKAHALMIDHSSTFHKIP